MKFTINILMAILVLLISKILWTVIMTRNIGSFESERADLLQRQNYLLDKVVTDPQKLIDAMPAAVPWHGIDK